MNRTRFVVASLGLFVAGWIANGVQETQPPVAAVMEPQCSRLPPSLTVQLGSADRTASDLPRWFGDNSRPRARIAGRVIGGAAKTVRLAINVPDPSVWAGREVAVGADGSFDFGAMRAGSYLLAAFDGEPVSAVVPVDTAIAFDRITLYPAACQRVHGWFRTTSDRTSEDALPAGGMDVALHGWVLGATDASGAYDVCVPEGSDAARLRVSGFGDRPLSARLDRGSVHLLWPERREAGFVLGADGRPAIHVGVQPIWRIGDTMADCEASSAVTTTDDAGMFTFNSANRLCGFRIMRGSSKQHDAYYDRTKFGSPQILHLPRFGGEQHLFD